MGFAPILLCMKQLVGLWAFLFFCVALWYVSPVLSLAVYALGAVISVMWKRL